VSTLLEGLVELFSTRGWRVVTGTNDPLLSRFSIIAENSVAIVFGVEIQASALTKTSLGLAGTIAAFLSPQGGPKAWEAYLLLFTEGLASVTDEELMAVKSDLNYCRRLVLDCDALLASSDGRLELERQLSPLFPLAPTGSGFQVSIEAMLEDFLIGKGHDPDTVGALVGGYGRDHFDPVAYLTSGPRPPEAK
jgi:hypothetical protein